MPYNSYECDNCGAEKRFASGGVRARHPCQECGATTSWTKQEGEA